MRKGPLIAILSLTSSGFAVGGAQALPPSSIPIWATIGGVVGLCTISVSVAVVIQNLKNSVTSLRLANTELRGVLADIAADLKVMKSDSYQRYVDHEKRLIKLEERDH